MASGFLEVSCSAIPDCLKRKAPPKLNVQPSGSRRRHAF